VLRVPHQFRLVAFAVGTLTFTSAGSADEVEFQRDVAPLLQRYCTGCHNATDYESDLSMDTFATFIEGGESGKPLVNGGDIENSYLIQVVEGAKKPKMPPKKEPQPSEAEIEVLKNWVAEGAKPPADPDAPIHRLVTPAIPPATGAGPITASAVSSKGDVAIARYGAVELRRDSEPAKKFEKLPGKVNALGFSPDGERLVAATGVTGLRGVARVWKQGAMERDFSNGHRDVLYAAEFSPDGSLLATAGYDGRALLWNVESGEFVREVGRHNGAIYDLAFSPDGAVVTTASGDETAKLWRVSDGVRLDTLHQPQGEQFCTAFSPDSAHVFVAGADNRIRMYAFVSRAEPEINPVLRSRFAHEGGIVAMAVSQDGKRLVSAGDDRSVSVWRLPELQLVERLPEQPDIVTSLVFAEKRLLLTRMDGSHEMVSLPEPETKSVGGEGETDVVTHIVSGANAEPQSIAEKEPNDAVAQAQVIAGAAVIEGGIASPGDVDLYAFDLEKTARWVFEVEASRRGSKLDSKIEVLNAAGEPVERVQLQAVRDSWFTFRGKDSNTSDDFRLHNWEEMELNEFLYAGGEVVKLWHYPRGPDSGFMVYPGFGNRHTYFGTTARTQALNAPGYIVRDYPPNQELVPNGLPTFKLFYENDDDSKRRRGSDSWLLFEAPISGRFYLRVSDVRSFGGEKFDYKLTARPAIPDFKVLVDGGMNPAPSPGSGMEVVFRAERLDGFTGEISLELIGLPPGFEMSLPIVIEAEQERAIGLLRAAVDAQAPGEETKSTSRVTAKATVGNSEVVREVGSLGEIKLGAAPKLRVTILAEGGGDEPLEEMAVARGQTVTARVKVERNGFDGRISFGSSDAGRNLPHGVYVDNIGLNGLLIVEDQNERHFFVTASPVAEPGERWFHLRTTEDGGQASQPIRIRVLD
jgi:WD40 repeat protein